MLDTCLLGAIRVWPGLTGNLSSSATKLSSDVRISESGLCKARHNTQPKKFCSEAASFFCVNNSLLLGEWLPGELRQQFSIFARHLVDVLPQAVARFLSRLLPGRTGSSCDYRCLASRTHS